MNALTDRRRSWSWLALVAVASTPSSAAESFTIKQVMSAPYPTSLVAAADADRIAWAENERGARSLWTAVGPAFEPERLVFYEEDDGQAIGGLRLSPDGSMLVFGRGGAPNPAGEIPNPASLIEPTERALWSVSTSGGDPWRLAEGGGAVINPDGARALFARAGEVFEVPLASPTGDEPVDATRLFKVRGGVGNLEPSPDGESVAFVSSRGDHSFVGVFHRADKRITWMSPSFDRDVSPVWSGDGRKIAFLRAPGALMHERIYYNTEVPFGIWVGDPATGEASEVWATLSGDGGFAQVASLWSLAWAGNDRLVFPSEAGGWLHYWSVAATGGDPVELTPGRGLVEWATLANDGRTLVFASNLASTHRRHLFSVPVDGGTPSQLTQGAVSDTGPVMVADQIAFRRATARRPPAVSLTGIAGGDVKTIGPALPASFPADSLIEPEVVSFEAADGLTIHGQLFRSESGDDERRRPAAIFLHGGPIRQMLPTFHYSSYYSNAFAFNQYLASLGYVVLALNYRSGIGYGRSFRAAEAQGPFGASEHQDLVAAGQFLASRDDVDPDRIGLWGGSYGGLMTAMGLARDSHLFAAGVDLHGVHDWAYRGEYFWLPGGFWGLGPDDYELARRSSPVFDVDSWSSPVLMIHGDDDRNVDFIQTTDLVQRLRRKGVHVESLVFPDEVHGFLRHASWVEAYKRADQFFERFLSP